MWDKPGNNECFASMIPPPTNERLILLRGGGPGSMIPKGEFDHDAVKVVRIEQFQKAFLWSFSWSGQ